MTTIFLIRHGEIRQSEPRRFVGRRDLPLTERGRAQIAALAEYLAARPVSGVVCSPLERCRESAAILCSRIGRTPRVVPDLAEISLGDWEGLTVAQVQQRFPGSHEARGRDLAGYRPPNGESFADLQARAWPAFESLVREGNDLAIVAHSGVNRTILCRILDLPLGRLLSLEQDYGCLNAIRHDSHGFWIEEMNCLPA